MFEKILVANRGEVGARVARTCRRIGADTVALCVPGEEEAVHTQACDAVAMLQEANGEDAYRRTENIVRAAVEAGCQAVHPGYGLLEGSVQLARDLEKRGIQWIGAAPELVVLVRDRAALRGAALEAGLRVLAGSSDALTDPAQIREEIAALGLPLVAKPAFALGEDETLTLLVDDESVDAWEASRKGDEEVAIVLERYVERPRHVEVIVVGDGTDIAVVGEVETSARKDHRRVISESPAPAIDSLHRADAARSAVWAGAYDLASYLGLRGVAAIQFLFDGMGRFHFVGMTLGLTPEHALVELCTGVDLVEVECQLALGESLPRSVVTSEPTGHAVQARIDAAVDPRDGRPFPGRTEEVRWPPAPTGKVRIETGIQAKSRVQVHHDALVASVSTFAPTRHEAVLMLDRIIAETRIGPLVTNLRLLRRALNLESFRALQIDEGTLDRT